MSSRRSGNKPQRRDTGGLKPSPAAAGSRDTGRETPYFCLNCQQPGYMVTDLDDQGQLAFLHALHQRRGMTWNELLLAPKHGLGYEKLPVSQLHASVPDGFADRDHVLVFRYSGLLPMAGVRVDNVFHLLFIERTFNELYDHGGS